MDHNLASGVRVKDGGDITDEPMDAKKLEMEMNPTSQEDDSLKHVRNYDAEVGDATAEVNMEAAITADDVIRAGGFGARDDISSFLPVAIDSTDFEASLRDARDFEEPQGEISRPGLGWAQSVDEK